MRQVHIDRTAPWCHGRLRERGSSMGLLGRATVSFAIVIGCVSAAHAGPTCGRNPGDASMVASLSGMVATQCDCCNPPGANARCVLGIIKPAMRSGSLSRMCARKLLRNTIRACPAGAGTACHLCNTDRDCAAGEFCECRLASCDKTGGVCTQRPEVCPQVVAPVCGCDGMTYANDCQRQSAGACKRQNGPCIETGGCFDTIAHACTTESCSPESPCKLPNQFCTPRCAAPPFKGTCFDLLGGACTTRPCGEGLDCLPNETCVAMCPPPPPAGKCFATVDGACSDEPCGPDHPCRQPNEFCNPACLGSPGACTIDADCDDGNGCSADRCVDGTCQHVCLCVGPQGSSTCCPGPAALCTRPCSADPTQACGGACPPGASCMELPGADTCTCVSPLGGPCGGTIFVPTVCAPGLMCKQSHPDATGVCVEPQQPCAGDASCAGPCTMICPDGSTTAGTCAPGPDPNLPCECTAQCNPMPTPTAGPCGGVDACGGACPLSCPDGSIATGQCRVVVVDPPPPGKPGEPIGPTCLCLGGCSPAPTPTPGPCDQSATCSGICPFICPDGTATTGHCYGPPMIAEKPGPPGARPCSCVAQCGPILPHGTICCQCGDPASACFEKHWVEVTPNCPEGCTTVVNGTCDATNSCVRPTACHSDAECDDGDACTVDRCDNGACAHDCVCTDSHGSCRPGPLAKPNFTRH